MDRKTAELVSLLEKQNEILQDKETELKNRAEELEAQKEELTAAVEELIKKNTFLNDTLNQLKERNAELNQLVYRTSHDLKSPVTSVLGILYLVEQEKLSPALKQYALLIEKTMHQMSDMLYSISLFNTASEGEVHHTSFRFQDLIAQTKSAISVEDKPQEVHFQLLSGQDLVVNTDFLLLKEVLKAVLNNAFQYRNLTNPYIKIEAEQIDHQLVITVEDNGEGMLAMVANHAFDMFYRGSNKSKGSGLGLYVAKKIIQRLKGSIELHPQPVGLQVKISLPVISC